MKKIIFLLGVFLFYAQSFAQNTKQSHEAINTIDSIMKQYSKMGFFNGNVLVSRNNKIIYNSAFGYTDATKTQKLTPDYRFNIGSITKEFSAVALMQLKEQGKLKLDDKVSKFIPGLPKWANEISIKNLLQYTSGIPNVNWKKIQTDKDIFADLMLIDTLDFKPGTNYGYNNNNIFLRQFIVERLTGIPFRNYVEKFIFKPCKMTSSFVTPFENEKNIAKGFTNKGVPDKPDLPITGGTYTTTTDLLKWADGLHRNKVINKNSLLELAQQFDLPETQSALGLTKFNNKKLTWHLHDGRAGSYEALMVSDMDQELTIILLGNNYNGKIFEISDEIDSVLKDEKYLLRKEINQIIAAKNAIVGFSVKNIEDKDTLSINGNLNAPLMSVFKFHIALAVLDLVDKGKFSLTQKFFIKKEDLHDNTWSPMRDEFANGNIDLTLDQLLRYTVSHSDNNGCDILLELISGTETVQKFIHKHGIKDCTIKVNEAQMQTWENLYTNTTTPLATTELLEKFYTGKVLKKKSTDYLYQLMVECSRGITWMKAGLPKGTQVAHRTGISSTNENNLRAAMNDVGIVKLPNSKHLIISIYLKNITETREDTEKIIADITKTIWEYYSKK